MKNTKTKKILAVNFGGIGDEILFFPTLKTLKSAYKNAHLTLVTEPRSKSAKSLTNLVDDIITCDIKGKDKYLEIYKFLKQAWTGQFDVVISSGSSKVVSILLFLTGISERYGYNSGIISKLLLTGAVPLNRKQYAANMYHDLTKEIAPNAGYELPEVIITHEDLDWANKVIADHDKKVILIHPGVSQMSIDKTIFKFWSVENWAELVKMLVETDRYRIILAGGPDDDVVINRIKEKLENQNSHGNNVIDMFGKTKNIAQLAALIKMSDMVICVDSAPMHIAVGTGTRTVAIFGPTNENKLLPPNDNRFTAVKVENLGCRPCLWDKRQVSCDNPLCLNVSINSVMEVVEQLYPF